MLIKLDETLSHAHTEFLKQIGYECDRVSDERLSGATDEVVLMQVGSMPLQGDAMPLHIGCNVNVG